MSSGSILPRTMFSRTVALIAIILVVAIFAVTAFFLFRNDESEGHTDLITLAAPATSGPPQTTDGILITHLAMTGGTPGNTDLTVSLTDMKGRSLPINGDYSVQLAATNLSTGATVVPQDMEPEETATTPTFDIDDSGLDDDGWWRIRTTVDRPDGAPVASEFNVLLPDPNLAGFDAPAAPEDDPGTAKILEDALTQMSEWTSIQWWQWLSGGNDSLIMSRLAVTTTAANDQPDSFRNDMLFAAGFERNNSGAPPAPPSTNHYSAVTIGDEAWSRNAEGEVEEMSPTRYLPINQYPETYAGATSIQSGIEDEVDGRAARIVTFHVPRQTSQAEAWFAFWIDSETGDVLKLAMIAQNHYMVWIYSDFNADFVIEPPEGAIPVGTPSASPIASPAS